MSEKPTIRPCSPLRVIRGVSRKQLMELLAPLGSRISRVCHKQHKNAVLFTPQASDELNMVTHAGQLHPDNATECQYILEGYYFAHEDKSTTTVVTRVISLASVCREDGFTRRSNAEDNFCVRQLSTQEQYLHQYSRSHNRDLVRGVPINSLADRFGSPHQVGEGHTHPSLGVFWSVTDRTNVHARIGEPYVNIVIDPHKAPVEVLAGTGPELTPCRVEFMVWDASPASSASSESPAQSAAPHRPCDDVRLHFFCRSLRLSLLLSAAVLALGHVAAALLS